MHSQHARPWSRRRFLKRVTLAGMTGLLGVRPRSVAAEPPLETTRLRLVRIPSICQAPQYVAEALLKTEGFTEVHYVEKQGSKGIESALASGEADINMNFAAPTLLRLDAGDPVVILAGGHNGCFELFGAEGVRAIRDLKGKTVAVSELGSADHVFIASMVAYVGLDPQRDIQWVTYALDEAKRLLTESRIDALLALPPAAQELRAQRIGHVVVNSAVDHPWSQ